MALATMTVRCGAQTWPGLDAGKLTFGDTTDPASRVRMSRWHNHNRVLPTPHMRRDRMIEGTTKMSTCGLMDFGTFVKLSEAPGLRCSSISSFSALAMLVGMGPVVACASTSASAVVRAVSWRSVAGAVSVTA